MSSFGSKVSATLSPGAPVSHAAANSSRAQPGSSRSSRMRNEVSDQARRRSSQLSSIRPVAASMRTRISRVGAPMACVSSAESVAREHRAHGFELRRFHLQHHAQLLAEQRARGAIGAGG